MKKVNMLNFILWILQSYMRHIVSLMIMYLLTLRANLSSNEDFHWKFIHIIELISNNILLF